MNATYRTIVLLLFLVQASHAQETSNTSFGKGIFNIVGKDSTWSMTIATRMQILSVFNFEKNTNGQLINQPSDFAIRRARLKFDGFAYSPKLEYKIELGLSNQDISGGSIYTGDAPRYIFDAVLMWNFYENFEFWLGQTKLPGNIERVISSGNLQQVDRSLLNRSFNIDRDMGIQLRHKTNLTKKFLMREILAISQGEGRNITVGNFGGYQYTTRLELLPFGTFENGGDYSGADLKREENARLLLAVTYDFNNNAVKTRSNQGSYMLNDTGFFETNINSLFVDAMFKFQGFSFMGEYALRNADDAMAKNSDGTLTGDMVQVGSGLNLQSGYLFENNWEVSGRYTNVSLDEISIGERIENQYTVGLSKYIVGHKLKVQTDLSYLTVANSADELMYRLQVDIHF